MAKEVQAGSQQNYSTCSTTIMTPGNSPTRLSERIRISLSSAPTTASRRGSGTLGPGHPMLRGGGHARLHRIVAISAEFVLDDSRLGCGANLDCDLLRRGTCRGRGGHQILSQVLKLHSRTLASMPSRRHYAVPLKAAPFEAVICSEISPTNGTPPQQWGSKLDRLVRSGLAAGGSKSRVLVAHRR
jgi:hypothetical protein